MVVVFLSCVCVMVKLPYLFGTVAVRDNGYFGSCVSILCLLLCATVSELRALKNSQVLEITECVSFERVDYFSSVVCVDSG